MQRDLKSAVPHIKIEKKEESGGWQRYISYDTKYQMIHLELSPVERESPDWAGVCAKEKNKTADRNWSGYFYAKDCICFLLGRPAAKGAERKLFDSIASSQFLVLAD